jgi:hypothetical protein
MIGTMTKMPTTATTGPNVWACRSICSYLSGVTGLPLPASLGELRARGRDSEGQADEEQNAGGPWRACDRPKRFGRRRHHADRAGD